MTRDKLFAIGTFLSILSTGAWVTQPTALASAADRTAAAPATAPADREVVVPAGTVLSVELRSHVASDSSRVEDAVAGRLRRPITIGGVTAIPAGTVLSGHITDVERSGRVKGRARVAFRFNQLDLAGAGNRVPIRTNVVARRAQATKKVDAAKIGGGAAGGALIGAIVGGGDGAAKGAAIGGAAGTGVVLATRGKDVRLGPGTPVAVRLLQPITIRVRS